MVNKKNDLMLNIMLCEFYEIVPKAYIEIFTPDEFEMVVNGLKEIDITDWEKNTIYKGKYTESS